MDTILYNLNHLNGRDPLTIAGLMAIGYLTSYFGIGIGQAIRSAFRKVKADD